MSCQQILIRDLYAQKFPLRCNLLKRLFLSAQAVATMQSVYDEFLSHYKDRMAEVMNEVVVVKNANIELQRQFNEIQLQYAKEIEKSQNWEKLHRELSEKYAFLERDYEQLKIDHYQLKRDFDKYKKAN